MEKIPEDFKDEFEAYLRRHRIKRQRNSSHDLAEIQDLHLADRFLPSHTGAITGDLEQRGYRHSVYVDIPTWAVRLQLLRAKNYTLTDRGQVLLMSGLQSMDIPVKGIGKNPLLLNYPEKYVALFCLIDSDGDLIRRMYQELLAQQTFSRSDAGLAAGNALKSIRTELSNATGSLRQFRGRVARAIDAIDKQKGDKSGPRESIATPRTEPLVDCGILEKLDPETYEYRITSWGMLFLEALIDSSSAGDFLDQKLTSLMCRATGHQLSDSPPRLGFVASAYEGLRTGLGYVSVRELALGSIAQALSSPPGPVYEIATVEKAIRRAGADRLARIAQGRKAGNAQVRIDLRALKASET